MRKTILLLICIATSLNIWADENISFTANAPEVVVSGDQFRLTYTINTQKVKDFRVPNIKDFEVLMGPSRATQSSTHIDNGKVTSVSSITFTYILMADKEGSYTIPGATIVAEGNPYTSNSVKIKVLPPDSSAGQGGASASNGQSTSRSGQISNKELFITATASKKNVYE